MPISILSGWRMECPRCKSIKIIKFGRIKTRKKGKRVQRFKCMDCKRTFTKRNFLPEYREKKPYLNEKFKDLYLEGVTLRGTARYLECDYRTAVRKFVKYSKIAKQKNNVIQLNKKSKLRVIQIDEMWT